MFLFVIPFIEAVANYMLPLLLGTRDLPFPRLTALSYWTFVFGGIFLYASFLWDVAPDGGWFAYVPLTNREYSPGINLDFWDIGLSVAEVAAIGAAAELIVGILRMRAPGMSLDRLPLFAWAMLVTAVMIIFAFTPLIVGTAMLELDRKGLTAFFKPEAGGEPLLWQHLFWVFGHPEVYIMFVPAVGIVSHVVQTFARRPLVSYTAMVLAIVATGFISFGLWVHHMFATGLPPLGMSFFAAASMLIAIPAGVQVFGWIATLWLGRPVWRTPLLFVLGFLLIFVLGGLTGVMLGAVPFDWQAHDSYFVVAHFHYVLIGGVVFPLVAGLYYWLPKITGRMLSERLGRWNFWVMFVFFNVAFFPMHISGLLGMPRRVYTYQAGLGWDVWNLVSTIGAIGFAAGVLLFVINVVWSRKHGAPAGPNPWESDTLEWSESSPPADAQFPLLPVVHSRHPLWDQRSLRPEHPDAARELRTLDAAPGGWRGSLCVSVLDARPVAVVHMPTSSYWPLVLAVGFVFLFTAALLDSLLLAGIGMLVSGVALTGWFWPMRSQALALRERRTDAGEDGELPLAVSGPSSNGWWGTLVLIATLATALATLVVSYFYLGPASQERSALGSPDVLLSVGAVLVALAATVTAFWSVREARSAAGSPARKGRRRLALAANCLLQLLLLWLTVGGYLLREGAPRNSAHDSIVLGLFGFQWLVTALVFVMALVAGLWALIAPADERGIAPAENAALVTYFAAAGWVLVLAAVYLDPALRWGGRA
jgi:cytochrome c oxidase subunit I+III